MDFTKECLEFQSRPDLPTDELYLSGWMANLGVVPWFLFFAFLLFPAFTALFFLH